MTDQYAGWRALLSGKKIEIDHNEPLSGFYRVKRGRGGPYIPVAYWRDETGKLICVVDGKLQDELRAVEQWVWAHQGPISHELYLAVAERGEPWPDMDATVSEQMKAPAPGHNNPPDELELLREQIESAKAGAAAYDKIADDNTQSKAQSLRSRLLELARDADKKREAEKKPHLEASKSVDAKWQPLVKMAKEFADKIAVAMGAWETVKAKKADEARRKAEDAARKAEAAGKPAPVAPAPIPEAVAPAPIKGAYGRAASVKVVKVATVTDQDKAYAFLKTHPELKDLIAKLAQRAVDAGHEVPGVTVEERRKVA